MSPASGWRKLAEKLTSPLARAAYWGIASNFFWMLLGALVMLQVLVAGGVDALPAVDW
ncbi:hypothetical protein [Micromonospora chalcea]|uniref:hypothetical protein n=1 Tax=Micromonospora chalcea TaxID=1874 RepID=UPI003D718FA3